MTKKKIIITAGPTNERIDAVMQITNMSTGSLGCRIAETILNNPETAEQVEKLYYISTKLAYKPKVDDFKDRLDCIRVDDTEELQAVLKVLLRNEHIDAVVHSAAVGDYKGKYVITGEALAQEIAGKVMEQIHQQGQESLTTQAINDIVLTVCDNPASIADNSTKISSYEPRLMVRLDLTPKVISQIKTWSPKTLLIGFKLLDHVSREELFDVASRLREKNNADYIIANDLSKIGGGDGHWAMVIGKDPDSDKSMVLKECQTKRDIAITIASLLFSKKDK